jgi:hypothetical protein
LKVLSDYNQPGVAMQVAEATRIGTSGAFGKSQRDGEEGAA